MSTYLADLLPPMPIAVKLHTLAIKPEILRITRILDGYIAESNVDLELYAQTRMLRGMVMDLKAAIASRDLETTVEPDEVSSRTRPNAEITLQTPDSWWDHLKLTFQLWARAKGWCVYPAIRWRNHPLQLVTTYTTIKRTTVVRHLCPHIGLDSDDIRHIRFLAPSEETPCPPLQPRSEN